MVGLNLHHVSKRGLSSLSGFQQAQVTTWTNDITFHIYASTDLNGLTKLKVSCKTKQNKKNP